MLKKISARAEDGLSCVSYIGAGGAGHFVKMAHNGIEYAEMQLIGEIIWALRDVLGYSVAKIADILEKWNNPSEPLVSYLLGITSKGLKKKDNRGF